VLELTFADLWFRARQFVIAVIGVGLVLAMALVLSGMAQGFTTEISQVVGGVGADSWVLSKASGGRITAFSAFPQAEVAAVRAEPGVRRADPLLLVPSQVAHVSGKAVTANLMGVTLGGLGDPAVVSGHRLEGPGQAVVDSKFPAPVGSALVLGGRPFTVVGQVDDRTLLGGIPLIYLSLTGAQLIALKGQPYITAVVTSGVPGHVPRGLIVTSSSQVVTTTVGQLSSAVSSIGNSRLLMWLVAAVIVAAILYVAALERTRDFAVLKALGASSGGLFGSLVTEAVVVVLAASLLAEVLSQFLSPLFAQTVSIPLSAYVTLPLVALVVAVLASLVALRRAVNADPAAAFG
jgi:putative ABC transport system permease protein